MSPENGQVKGWDETNWSKTSIVEVALDETCADEYDALVLPGGQINPDFLRINDKAVAFVKSFLRQANR